MIAGALEAPLSLANGVIEADLKVISSPMSASGRATSRSIGR